MDQPSTFSPITPERNETNILPQMPLPHLPKKVEPARLQKPQKPLTSTALIALYVIVFVLGLYLVYSSQHSQLQAAQKNLVVASSKKNAVADASKKIDSNKHQAVFMHNGQVYFGKITSLNEAYVTITDVYYLQTKDKNGQTIQSNSSTDGITSLVKLGCELHGPDDLMVINRDSVDFFENLKGNGEVAQAIKQFATQNPNGQKCS